MHFPSFGSNPTEDALFPHSRTCILIILSFPAALCLVHNHLQELMCGWVGGWVGSFSIHGGFPPNLLPLAMVSGDNKDCIPAHLSGHQARQEMIHLASAPMQKALLVLCSLPLCPAYLSSYRTAVGLL